MDDRRMVVQWERILCDCGTVIAEKSGRFLRYVCRDRRCTTGEEKVRMVYIDLSQDPPAVVTRRDVEQEIDNG